MSEKNQIDEQKELEAQQAVTDDEIAQGWRDTFSTSNPFCPCDLKSFTKAVRWAERALLAKAQQPDSDKKLERIGAVFQIGEKALTPGTVLANVENAKRRADCLSAIEREFFTVIKCDEDGEYEESVLSWGVSPDVYVEQFREALALLLAALSRQAAQEPPFDIDDRYAGRLALLLECMLIDPNGYWNDAAALLDEYKAEWDKANPQPPTFMGEPMPPERKARLMAMIAKRKEETP